MEQVRPSSGEADLEGAFRGAVPRAQRQPGHPTAIFDQDRLGTNIGKALKKGSVFSQEAFFAYAGIMPLFR